MVLATLPIPFHVEDNIKALKLVFFLIERWIELGNKKSIQANLESGEEEDAAWQEYGQLVGGVGEKDMAHVFGQRKTRG